MTLVAERSRSIDFRLAVLAYLRQQNEMGEITEAEHQELLAYVDRVECQDAERAEALIQLAKIRKVDLKTLIHEFMPVNKTI